MKYRYSLPISTLLLLTLLCGCFQPKIETDVAINNKFIENSVKTWQSIDTAVDIVYTMLGELYSRGKLTDQQRDKFIQIGTEIRQALIISKQSIADFAKAEQLNSNVSTQKERTINDLVFAVKTFYNMKDQIQELYHEITGQSIKIPDIFMFDSLTNLLIQRGK